VKALKSCE
jgi:hypothetical protein